MKKKKLKLALIILWTILVLSILLNLFQLKEKNSEPIKICNDCKYSKYDGKIYYEENVIEWADPKTFKILKQVDSYILWEEGVDYWIDKNNCYAGFKKLDKTKCKNLEK